MIKHPQKQEFLKKNNKRGRVVRVFTKLTVKSLIQMAILTILLGQFFFKENVRYPES